MTTELEVICKKKDTEDFVKNLDPGDCFTYSNSTTSSPFMVLDECDPNNKDMRLVVDLAYGVIARIHVNSKVFPVKKVKIEWE